MCGGWLLELCEHLPSHMKSNILIGLIDCNNFFVSCERIFRPDLENVPTLVLSSNDGCVVARSQEVKDIGIPMGIPYFKVKDIVKDKGIAVFSGNLTLYRDISRRVFDIAREEFSEVEQYSIDEAFFTLPEKELSEARLLAMRKRIYCEVGVLVSVGVGYSKTIAKMATDEAKKQSGVHIFLQDSFLTKNANTPLSKVWGVGRNMNVALQGVGLQTINDLICAEPALLRQVYGVVAARLQAELRGSYVNQVCPKRPLQRSVMSSKSFNKTTNNMTILEDALAHHVRHIAADLRSMQSVASVIRVSLGTSRHGDYFMRGGSQEAGLGEGSDDTFVLMRAAHDLLRELYEPGVLYQKVGVTVSGIRLAGSMSHNLFEEAGSAANGELLAIVDGLNKKGNRELISIGTRLRSEAWQAKSAKRSPACTTQWSDLITVSAR